MSEPLVKKSLLLDLDVLASESSGFAERLDRLLDELGVVEHGKGRLEWLAQAAGVRRLAASNWFKSGNPRKSNLERFAKHICEHSQLAVLPGEIVAYLQGDTGPVNVAEELTRAGLNGPEQAQVQIVVSRAMQEHGLDPLAEEHLALWTKVVLRMGRFYVSKRAKNQLPDEPSLVATAAAFLHLAQEGAI